MPHLFLRVFCLLVISCMVLTPTLRAQVFQVSSTAVTVIDTALTALAGGLGFPLTSGTTGTGSIFVTYNGVAISNNGSSGITVTGTGDLAAAALADVDQSGGKIAISVPEGGTAGDQINLHGVRLDIANSSVSSVSADISSSQGAGFLFAAGSNSVPVIRDVRQGLKVEATSDTLFGFQGTVLIKDAFNFQLSEGYAAAFSDAVGTLGQTVATRIKIEVKGLPEGSTLTFPNSVTDSDTGATLTALSGSELTLPTTQGDATITYVFAGGASSLSEIDTFVIKYSLDVAIAPPEPAVVSLQATLSPFQEPDIPRFQARLVPSEEELPLPEFDLFVPVLLGGGPLSGIAWTNPTDLELEVQLEALTPSGDSVGGSEIVNPTSLTLPALAQRAVVLEEVFGSGISAVKIGTIRARTRRSKPVSLFFMGDDNGTVLEGATAGQDPLKNFLLPNVAQDGPSPFTFVYLYNPATSSLEVELTLYDDAGTSVASETVVVPAGGTFSQDVADLMGVDPRLISGGYIRGTATANVVAFESFGNAQSLNVLGAQDPTLRLETYRIPHFAVGSGFETELNLINADPSRTAVMQVAAFDDAGMPLGMGPVPVVLEPGEQALLSIGSALGLSSQPLVVGSLRIDVEKVFSGPFGIVPFVTGSVRFKTDHTSASLPLFSPSRTTALYPHVAQTSGFFTGIAVLNPEPVPVEVTVEVFDEEGVLVGSSTLTLAEGARKVALLKELVPASDGRTGGYFLLRGTPVRDVLFSGSHTGSGDSARLLDSGADLADLGLRINRDLVRNVTDGSEGVITGVEGNFLTAILRGGRDNDWDPGDNYEILDGEPSGSIVSFALLGDLEGRFMSFVPSP